MKVCKRGCDVNDVLHKFEKGFELKNSSRSLLYLPISSSAETWKIFRNMLFFGEDAWGRCAVARFVRSVVSVPLRQF